MNYGQHDSVVQDVIRLVDDREILKWKGFPPVRNALLTHDVDAPRRYAVEVPEQYYETGYATWADIRGCVFGKEATGLPEADDDVVIRELEPRLWSLVYFLSEQCRRLVDGMHLGLAPNCGEIIGEDLGMIAYRRALVGIRPGMLETMFTAYRWGGYPCGWEGCWPKHGRLVIYCSDPS